MKNCTKYKIQHDISFFNKDKKTKDGLTFHCKKCLSKKFKKWRATNHKKHNEDARKWNRQNKDICRARALKWNKDNRELVNARYIARKKHIKLATPKWTNKAELLEFYKNRPLGYHVDHIVPLQGENVSGLHVIWNLQYLPASENIAKGNRF